MICHVINLSSSPPELCEEGSLYDYVRNLDNHLDHVLRQQWAMEIAKGVLCTAPDWGISSVEMVLNWLIYMYIYMSTETNSS